MNNIVISKEHNIYSQPQSSDKLKLTIVSDKHSEIIESLNYFLTELSMNGEVFKYYVTNQENDTTSLEVSIKFFFDTTYIQMIYNDLDLEIKANTIKLEQLNQYNCLSSITERLFDDKIEELTKRNEDLTKQLNIIKMQLLNAINKRDVFIGKINEYIDSSIDNCIATYISTSTDVEKSFMDFDSICESNQINREI